jgi:hypothetical protein
MLQLILSPVISQLPNHKLMGPPQTTAYLNDQMGKQLTIQYPVTFLSFHVQNNMFIMNIQPVPFLSIWLTGKKSCITVGFRNNPHSLLKG